MRDHEVDNALDAAPSTSPVASTSRWMAAERARESERADRLFDDPLAEALAGPVGFEWMESMRRAQPWGGPGLYSVIRTRFFDDFVMEACEDLGISQVVIAAAGMDTRAFRLGWPSGTRLYELDLPEVLDAKEAVIGAAGARANCERRAIGVDLKQATWPEALLAAGYDAQRPSVWLVEGLLYYLTEASVHVFLEKVGAQASTGSLLGLDVMNRGLLSSPTTWLLRAALAQRGVPGRFGTDDPKRLLTLHGWEEADVTQPGEDEASYGARWPSPMMPWTLPGSPQGFLMRARRS